MIVQKISPSVALLIIQVLVVFLSFVNTVKYNCTAITSGCPKICRCSYKDNSAKCSNLGKNLSCIPQLPLYVTKLHLDSDHFPWITHKTFQHIIHNNISDLSFKSSTLYHVGPSAFEDITHLTNLDLSSNIRLNASSVQLSLASLKPQILGILRFDYMNWSNHEFNKSLFINLKGKHIKTFSIKNNNLHIIPEAVILGLEKTRKLYLSENKLTTCEPTLRKLSNLTELVLSQNSLTKCEIQNLPNTLRKLRLNNNFLTSIPTFCSGKGTSLLPDLYRLRMDYNNVHKITQASFRCLNALQYLSLKQNNIRKFPSFAFYNLHSLKTLFVNEMKGKVHQIQENAFVIPTLHKFYFSGNYFHFDVDNFDARATLSNCTNLQVLDLSFNHMPRWPMGNKLLLGRLYNLRKITLQQVTWNHVPDRFFKMFPKLETVILSHNTIASLNSSMFSTDSKILAMRLDSNRIVHIGRDTFTSSFWKNVKKIDLSANPFCCDCKLLWFRNLLKNSTIKFALYPYLYKCLSPPAKKGILLSEFNLTYYECQPRTELITAVISSSSVVIVMFLGVLVVYNGRWHIRYWIYLLRYKRLEYQRLTNANFKYDGFVIYCEEDSDFVHNTLINRIENIEGYQLCVHQRDFSPGKMIVDNIVECMSKSRLAVVVVSKHFCKSKWCKFELIIAQDRWFRNESEALLLILLEEIDSDHMTKDIRALIQSTTYCMWSKKATGKRLFWEKITNAFKQI